MSALLPSSPDTARPALIAPVLLLTRDAALAARWQSVSAHPQVATDTDALTGWHAAGRRLVLADLRLRDAHRVPLWESPAWQAHGSGLAVMALSMAPSDDEGLAVLQAGACGYGHALLPATHLHQALEIIEKGQLWVGRALLARLLHRVDERLRPTSPPAWAVPLTPREQEVARLAAQGASNSVIATTLGITERTVKAHLTAVFAKLEVADRLQLALRVHGVR